MKKRTVYSLESDIRRILEGNDFISTSDEGGKQWYMNLVTDLANFVQREIEKAREEGKLEYILSLGWQDTDNEYVKEVLEDAERIAEKLSKLKDNK